jgi:hypothetical protein
MSFFKSSPNEHLRFSHKMHLFEAVQWLRRLVTVFSPLPPELGPKSGHVGFVVDEVALGQFFSE